MSKLNERLVEAREKAGYKSALRFCEDHNLVYTTYKGHERGSRTPSMDDLRNYAQKLNVSLAWLMLGEGSRAPEPIYDQASTSPGFADEGYKGTSAPRQTSPQSLSVEISDFLARYHSLSPAALKSIKQILKDEIFESIPEEGLSEAIKSPADEKRLSEGDAPAKTGKR